MKKYFFGKKTFEIDENEALLRFKNEQNLREFYQKIEEICVFVNFKGELRNWASFCKDNDYCYKAFPEKLYIEVTKCR
jgi:hypothetical protein